MAKRLSSTEKWEDRWFSALALKHKVIWLYLVDRCDAAGVWEPNFALVEFQTGIRKINWDEVRQVFSEKVRVVRNGRWWMPGFVCFQYGEELHPEAKVHLSIIRMLEKHGLWDEYRKWLDDRANAKLREAGDNTMPIPLEWDKVKEQDKEKELFPDQAGVIVFPAAINSQAFKAAWGEWLAYRKERKLPAYKPRGESAQLKRLGEMGEKDAIRAIIFSMAQNYQGIFPEGGGAGGKPGKKMSFA